MYNENVYYIQQYLYVNRLSFCQVLKMNIFFTGCAETSFFNVDFLKESEVHQF